MSQNMWRDERPELHSKSFLHRQCFSLEQGQWMMEEYYKRGWKILILTKSKAKKSSLVMSKTGQQKIVLHYTSIGGFGQYYCMIFPENTDIPGRELPRRELLIARECKDSDPL